MNEPKVFGVYTARFPYLDSREAKIRPVVVISKSTGRHGVIAIIPISSRPTREDVDVAIANWSDAGLLRASVARVHRLSTMLQGDLIASLGELGREDRHGLRASLKKFLDL